MHQSFDFFNSDGSIETIYYQRVLVKVEGSKILYVKAVSKKVQHCNFFTLMTITIIITTL